MDIFVYHLDGANLQMQTNSVSKIMHQNLAVSYAKSYDSSITAKIVL